MIWVNLLCAAVAVGFMAAASSKAKTSTDYALIAIAFLLLAKI